MSSPAPSLDARFSDPRAAPTNWVDARRVLEAAEMFWITTVRRDGRPHVTPLVAVWLDDAISFCTGAAEQKAINLEGNPRVILTTGSNDWDKGLDVVVEGEVGRITDEATLQRLAEQWAKKWDGRWKFVVGDACFHDEDDLDEPRHSVLVFSVSPSKVLAFAKGQFSQTRYRFSRNDQREDLP
jgi:general stress protein 26